MKRLLSCAAMLVLVLGLSAWGDEPAKSSTIKATFSITGLHCPPCTRTVASSLAKVPGVKSAKVDWGTKSAKLELDEAKTTVQGVASAIAATPHMMGAGMTYGSLFALNVPDMKDAESITKATMALREVEGIKQIAVHPQQHTVSVQFTPGNKLTTQELIKTLADVGLKASTY